MQRRNFLKSFGLAGAWLGAPVLVTKAAGKHNTAKGERVLSGKVHTGEKAIPGVAVTDGRSVVVTDKNGRYQISSHAEAEFVYISVPAGYVFNTT
ncbi:MAG TPA: metallophosphoesterase N-terminal domain-containing protein, partial [Flavisolibacter sp.]